ncbi:Snakin-1 [Ranunculus cassubicifolius]
MKLLPALLLISLLLSSSSFLDFTHGAAAPGTNKSPAPGFCNSKCKARCAKAGMKDRCLKYCGICCQECKCVPSGTYGNKDECPCYRDMKNSKGKDKCP